MAKKKAKASKKRPSKGRAAKKSSTAKTSAARPKKRPAAKSGGGRAKASRGNSVDGLLKQFENERKAQEAKLAKSLKRAEELEQKAAKLQEQIEKLKEMAKVTQQEIDQLDSRRDAEVAEVLAKLGVQLSANLPESEERPILTLGQSLDSHDQEDSEDED